MPCLSSQFKSDFSSSNTSILSGFRMSAFGSLVLAVCLPSLLTQISDAETDRGNLVHFRPPVGQPIFPVGNLNVFKQFWVGAFFAERIKARITVELLVTELEFGMTFRIV
ncbi:MAG: hypothetical protein ACJAVK_003465 [Akkermansiaceae bacterium]|jgi:hypothetical protein